MIEPTECIILVVFLRLELLFGRVIQGTYSQERTVLAFDQLSSMGISQESKGVKT